MINKPKQYTDEALVEMICSDSMSNRNKALYFILHESGWGKSAFGILLGQGVEKHDAKDAVQEAMIVLDRNIRNGKFDVQFTLKNYIIGIAKGRAYSIGRGKYRIDSTAEMPIIMLEETPETLAIEEEVVTVVRRLLKQLKEPCPEVLKLYMLSYSRRETNEILDIGTEGAVGKKIFDCRKELAKLIDANPTLKRFFNRE